MFQDFRLNRREFTYKTALELDLDKFVDAAKEEKKSALFDKDIADLRAGIEKEKSKDFDESKNYIRQSIKREFLRVLYGESGRSGG
jgi:hypothetical protein